MFNKRSGGRNVFNVIGLVLLSACSSIAQVQDVTADKAGYLSKNFSAQSLSPNVAKKIPREISVARFKTLTIIREGGAEQSGGKKETWKSVVTLVNVGNGLVQRMEEISNNDIPYGLFYSLTYKGVIDLKWQNVPLRGRVTSPIYEIKDTTRFDAIPLAMGKKSVIDYTSGMHGQIANFLSSQKTCKTLRTIAAKELNGKLTGQATEIECQLDTNKVVQSRGTWFLLQDYGAAISTEFASSSIKTTFRIVDVNG